MFYFSEENRLAALRRILESVGKTINARFSVRLWDGSMVPLGQEGLQIGGPLTRWHYHLWATPSCILKGRVSVGRPENGKCVEGEPSQKSPEMLHVWLVDHPDGRFASKMSLPRSLIQSLGNPEKAAN